MHHFGWPSFPRSRPAPPLDAALRERGVALVPATRADLPALVALYASFRMPGLLALPWSAAERWRFVEEQFALQHAHLLRHHPRADFWTIRAGAGLIGRLYLDRSRAAWHLLDLGLLPAARNHGLGTELIAWLQATTRPTAESVSLHVALDNPRAAALYARAGFVDIGLPHDLHQPMRWSVA